MVLSAVKYYLFATKLDRAWMHYWRFGPFGLEICLVPSGSKFKRCFPRQKQTESSRSIQYHRLDQIRKIMKIFKMKNHQFACSL